MKTLFSLGLVLLALSCSTPKGTNTKVPKKSTPAPRPRKDPLSTPPAKKAQAKPAPKKSASKPASVVVEGINFTKVRAGDIIVDQSLNGRGVVKRMVSFVSIDESPRFVVVRMNVDGVMEKVALWLDKTPPKAPSVWTPVGRVHYYGKFQKLFKNGTIFLQKRH